MSKEHHPYLVHFDESVSWKYIIIGTFPPNKVVREGNNSLADYFYGNKGGSLWQIIGKIFTDFNFALGARYERREKMIAWQKKYNVGITDTLKSVSRKNIKSASDSDLVIDQNDFNYSLKNYILENNSNIKKLIFTSSKGPNSAFELFKKLMGTEFGKVKAEMITNIASPSGNSNIAWLNVNDDKTMGLHPYFFNFIQVEKPFFLPFFKDRWKKKKLKIENKSDVKTPSAPKGIVSDFKVWSYKSVLPNPMEG